MKMFMWVLSLIAVVVILICLSFYFIGIFSSSNLREGNICIGEKCFKVELAKTETERDRGLMYREKLDKDKGMFFVFDKDGIYPFWMKNTLIPLDMVWVDSTGRVVFIAENVQPCKTLICPSVIPNVNAKYVLEINAGLCQEAGFKIGDELKIDIN